MLKKWRVSKRALIKYFLLQKEKNSINIDSSSSIYAVFWYNKSKTAGMEIENIIGAAAYSEKGDIDIELAETEGVNLVAKLNPSVTQEF